MFYFPDVPPPPYWMFFRNMTALRTEEVGSQRSLVPSPDTHTSGCTATLPAPPSVPAVLKPAFRSPPTAIPLTEKEQFVITTAEYFEGDDPPEVTAREIDPLMDQPKLFCHRVEVFADPQVQISDTAMKEQIGNLQIETLDLTRTHFKHQRRQSCDSSAQGATICINTLHRYRHLCSEKVLLSQRKHRTSFKIKKEKDTRVKLAGDETKNVSEEGEANRGPDSSADRESPGPHDKTVRVEVEWDIPMSVTLPVQVQADPAQQPFPFLDTTLADLGIQESEVKERVVWVDTKKTQVKNKAGKLKEKEITILEVRVKAQKPGDTELQEVLYSTEAHTDRSFCRTGMDILPWKQRGTGETELSPVQMTMALENKQPDLKEPERQREI
uniref:uncharacterized protein si:ch211-196f5.2 n=1 Tax=Solea senegalensis TaxID=28829 RepID=UPI001CD91507|nr:uncharacterized protein si:ch211-196f5.2 [Solea senegalensis]